MLALAILPALAAVVAATTTTAADLDHAALPSYHYGAAIPIECMNRSSYDPQPPLPYSAGHVPS